MASKFTHLHVHSHYSLLSALPKIPDLIDAAKKDGADALALTDNGNLYGAIEFYKACKADKIKPIVGIDAYIALRTRTDKQAGIDNRRHRLILLAKNVEGYRNLLKLVTLSHIEGFYYKPRMDREILEKHAAGLIAIAPFWQSELSDSLKIGDADKTREIADWHTKTFGKENFFYELLHQPELSDYRPLRDKIESLAEKVAIPLVASHDIYYIHPDERKVRDILLSIQTTGDFRDRSTSESTDLSFLTSKQAAKNFKDVPQALENNEKIAGMINLELELGRWVFPDFKIASGKTADEELKRLTYEGIKRRGVPDTPEMNRRVEY